MECCLTLTLRPGCGVTGADLARETGAAAAAAGTAEVSDERSGWRDHVGTQPLRSETVAVRAVVSAGSVAAPIYSSGPRWRTHRYRLPWRCAQRARGR